MSSKGAVSLRQIDETRYNIQESIDALELGEEVDQVHTPIWQILLIVAIVLLAIAGIILVALRVFNKHKKEIRKQRKVRKKYKAMSEKNLAEAETVIDETTPTISQDTASLNIYESFTGETLERAPKAEPEAPAAPEAPVESDVSADSIKDDFQQMLKDLEDARKD